MRWVALLIVSALLQLDVAAAVPLRVGFYNVRNLYDTIGIDAIPATEYNAKIEALSGAIKLFAPSVVGFCEVENRAVVQDVAIRIGGLVLHYESNDRRGIDVAMIVDTALMEAVNSEPVRVGHGVRDFLRVDLKTKNSGVCFSIYVVHLPSKRGGARADKMRGHAHAFIDSVSQTARNLIFMGDFNDAPVEWNNLYNAALTPATKGVGSYAYRDVWSMIDQILISKSLLPYIVGSQKVVLHNSLFTPGGRYKSYPNRQVSDHLPIYIDVEL